MAKKRENWEKPLVYVQPFYWTVTNWGIFQGRIFYTRRDAKQFAEGLGVREGFADWRDVYEIRKVKLGEASR